MRLPEWMYFIIGVVLPTYSMLNWIGTHFGPLLRRLFVRTERDAIAWVHYRQRAAGERHAAKHPVDCADGACTTIQSR